MLRNSSNSASNWSPLAGTLQELKEATLDSANMAIDPYALKTEHDRL